MTDETDGKVEEEPTGQEPPQPEPPQPEPPALEPPTQEERSWAMLAHFGAALFSFIPPLIVYLAKKDQSKYISDQAKEALNFQITICLGYVVSMLLFCVVIGYLIGPGLWVISTVLSIVAGIKVNDGERYRYPFALRLIS